MDTKKQRKNILDIMLFYFFMPVSILVIVYFLYVLFFRQVDFFFHPTHSEKYYNLLKSNDEFEELKIESGEMSLSGWIKYDDISNEDKKPLVILFCGNADSTSSKLGKFYERGILKNFEGYNLISFDYPGYGFSKGVPSDTSLYEMSIAVYDYAKNMECNDMNNVVILGYSIGTGPATYLASQREVNGLILVAPYDNALNLYNDRLNIFHGPLKYIAKYKFSSDVYAKEVKVSPLIFSSKSDETVPYELSVNLSKCFENVYKFVELDNVSHGAYFNLPVVQDEIWNYLSERLEN